MSVYVSRFVWEHSDQKGNALLMLLALADVCNDDGECWLGVTSLQKRVRLTTKRGAQKLLESLEKGGEIRRVINGGKKTKSGNTNLYQMIPYRAANGLEDEQQEINTTENGVNNDSSDGVNEGSSDEEDVNNDSSDGANNDSSDAMNTDSSHEDGVNGGSSDGVNGGSSDGVNGGSSKPSLEPSLEPSVKDTNVSASGDASASVDSGRLLDDTIIRNIELSRESQAIPEPMYDQPIGPNPAPTIDFETYKAKLKEVFPTIPGSARNNLYNMLRDRSKTGKWEENNISPPVDFDELTRFGIWYRDNFPDQIPISKPETISKYIELFREGYVAEDNNAEPVPEYHREYVREDKPPRFKSQVDEITDMLEDLMSLRRIFPDTESSPTTAGDESESAFS